MALEKLDKKVYSFRFEEKLVSQLKGYANKENRSFSNFIETILKSYIAEKSTQKSM